MIDKIDKTVVERVAETIVDNARPGSTIHTLTIILNGAHGGVDVIADLDNPDGSPMNKYSWRVQ